MPKSNKRKISNVLSSNNVPAFSRNRNAPIRLPESSTYRIPDAFHINSGTSTESVPPDSKTYSNSGQNFQNEVECVCYLKKDKKSVAAQVIEFAEEMATKGKVALPELRNYTMLASFDCLLKQLPKEAKDKAFMQIVVYLSKLYCDEYLEDEDDGE